MPAITCQLCSHSNCTPLQQLYTGFHLLQRRGIVKLEQTIVRQEIRNAQAPQHVRYARYAHLRVVVNKRLNVHYDVHDSCEIDEEYLDKSDYYFKRSYCSSYLKGLGRNRNKVRPLGLNYLVYPDSADRFALPRVFMPDPEKKEKFREVLRATGLARRLRFSRTVSALQSLPDYDAPSRILFMTGLWDPHDEPERAQDKIDERIWINETRARCIALLRREFGDRFYGGLIHSEFARKNYPDALLPDNSQTESRRYFDLLKRHPICLATTGLHGSIGWKFAEYVAFAKAIVSEKLNFEVPGRLAPGVNFLEFESPEDCVTQASRLFSDRQLRNSLMDANARYYQSHLRPDMLVLNTILAAVSETETDHFAEGVEQVASLEALQAADLANRELPTR